MHMRIDAIIVAAAVLTASNCRETVSLFANYTSSKGVSMETTLDPQLITTFTHRTRIASLSSMKMSVASSDVLELQLTAQELLHTK